MIVGFTGSRDGMNDFQHCAVEELLIKLQPSQFHHGDCLGADAEAHAIAYELDIYTVIHPPIKDIYRAFCEGSEVRESKEYIKRNHDIVNEADILLAAPNQNSESLRSGTWATVRYARVPTYLILPKGVVDVRM